MLPRLMTIVALLALSGCPSNDYPNAPDAGAGQDMGDEPSDDVAVDRRSRLELLTEPEPAVSFDTRVPMRVALLDADDEPLPDVLVAFEIAGDSAGSALETGDTRTDEDGIAEVVLTTGELEADFAVVVTVPDEDDVEPLRVDIHVRALPDRAYARTPDDLEPGATIVTEDELDAMVDRGEAWPVSLASARAAEDAAAAKEADDDRIIAAWEAAHPGRTLMPDDVEDPGSMSLPRGTTLITVAMANGDLREFEAMGDRWVKGEITSALATFPTLDNQVAWYTQLYEKIPIQYRDQLGLVAPDVVTADPATYDAVAVSGFNAAIIAHADEIAVYQPNPNIPAGYVANCDLEDHAGEGGDRGGNDYVDPACKPDPNGLWANVDFPMKWYATCVKDQGNRGTCVAFASASAMELSVAQTESRWVNLSEQALYRKMKFEWENPRRDVTDGFITSRVFPRFGTWRLPYEEAWNYNPSLNRIRDYIYVDAPWYEHSCDGYDEWCSESSHQTPLFCAEVGGVMECAYGWVGFTAQTSAVGVATSAQIWNHDDPQQSVQLMRLALWMRFPITMGFDCGWACGHAVNVVGYVDNGVLADQVPSMAPGAGGGYFIIKNSYSNCHGDAGYDYFDYDYVRDNAKNATALHGTSSFP